MMDGREEPEEELGLATAAVRATAVRLLGEGEASPRLVARLLARVAGELGAEAALAGGTELEASLASLAEALRRAGADHHAAPRPGPDLGLAAKSA
jgi:hypothetical protein